MWAQTRGATGKMECSKTRPHPHPARWEYQKLSPELRNLGYLAPAAGQVGRGTCAEWGE